MAFDASKFLREDFIPIGKPNEYSNGWYQCQICNRRSMTKDNAHFHEREPVHQERVELIEAAQSCAWDTYDNVNHALALELRVDKLGLQKWKDGMKLILFDIVAGRDQLSVAEELLEKYEDMERISSLELAIWKHACIQIPTKTVSNNALDWQGWFQQGWKENKDSTRHSPAISGIIPHVLPFLGVQRYKGN
jgi:hypothetical protein